MAFSPSLICRRLISRSRSVCHTHRMSTTACKSVLPPKIREFSVPSPCLMLPPSLDHGTGSIDYNFYSLAENKVVTLPQAKGLNDLMPKPIRDLKICGSSHGWIALFNPHTLDLFIYNPISLRHIKLPPIPNYPKDSKRYVKKLILSCSPEQTSCRAVMIYNRLHEVVFCYPGRSNEWTPIGDMYRKGYYDFAYSSRQNLFFGLNHSKLLKTWDLSDSSPPRLIKEVDFSNKTTGMYHVGIIGVEPLVEQCLVVADGLFYDDEIEVLLVTRCMVPEVAPDGSFIGYDRPSDSSVYPHMTIGFNIDVYDQEEDLLCQDGLGDLTLFIGSCSDSFALSTTQFPQLKSRSIYFTDDRCAKTGCTDKLFGGHDIGIYNWENNTVSPCYYPCDRPNLKTIEPPTNWFFPSSF